MENLALSAKYFSDIPLVVSLMMGLKLYVYSAWRKSNKNTMKENAIIVIECESEWLCIYIPGPNVLELQSIPV